MPNFFDCLLLYEELPSELMSTSTLESTSCLMGPCKGLTDCDVDRGQDDQVTPFRPVVLEGWLQGASKWMRAIQAVQVSHFGCRRKFPLTGGDFRRQPKSEICTILGLFLRLSRKILWQLSFMPNLVATSRAITIARTFSLSTLETT